MFWEAASNEVAFLAYFCHFIGVICFNKEKDRKNDYDLGTGKWGSIFCTISL
jgi:hypothetical protein